jgi:hypothetical protein
MHTDFDFRTKKSLKEAVAKGEMVGVHQPGPWGPDVKDGKGVVEGPAEYHRWYCAVIVKDNRIVKVTG